MSQIVFGEHGDYPFNDQTVLNADLTTCDGTIYLNSETADVSCVKCFATATEYMVNDGYNINTTPDTFYVYFVNPVFELLDNTGTEIPTYDGGGGGKYPDPDDPS